MKKKEIARWKCTIFLIMALGVLYFILLPPHGHDVYYWHWRIEALGKYIKLNGLHNLPCRIDNSAYDGYGYATSLFYGDYFLIIPALLTTCGLEIKRAFGVCLGIIMVARFTTAYFAGKTLAADFYENEKASNLGMVFAFFYSFSPYAMQNLVERSALGECVASIFLPIVAVATYRLINKDTLSGISNVIWLSIGLFGIVCSHVITTVLTAIGIILYACFSIKKLWKNKKIIGKLFLSAIFALALSAYWIFPFLEQFLSPSLSVDTFYSLEERTLKFPFAFVPYSLIYKFSDFFPELTANGWQPGCWIYPMIIGAVFWFAFRNKVKNKTIKTLFVLSWCVGILIMLPPVMKLAENVFSFLQFPWRLLGFISGFCALFLTYIIAVVHKPAVTRIIIAVCASSVAFACGITCLDYIKERHTYIYTSIPDTLYIPTGESNGLSAQRDGCLKSSFEHLEYTWIRNDDKIEIIYHNNVKNTYLTLPLYYYPGYTAYDTKNEKALDLVVGENGLVVVILGEDTDGQITVGYSGTIIQNISDIISLCAWTSLIIVFITFKIFKKFKCNSL